MGKSILRIENEKKTGGVDARYNHNMRIELPESGHINQELSKYNTELIKMRDDVKTPGEFVKKRLSELDYYKTHKLRKNGIIACEVLMAYGTQGLPKDFSVSRWAEQSKQFLEDTYGKENVISAVIHMDESAPHIHAIVMPIKDEKLSARAVNGDRDGLRNLHQKYYDDYMRQCGLEPPEVNRSGLKHEKTTTFYAALDRVFEEQLPQREPGETHETYYKRVNKIYHDQMLVQFQQKHEIKKLQDEVKLLKKSSRRKERKLKEKHEQQMIVSQKEYEKDLEGVLNAIGGDIDQAAEAIAFKDEYDAVMEYGEANHPEKTSMIKDAMAELERDYLSEKEIGHEEEIGRGE